jgi:hypothetical protein
MVCFLPERQSRRRSIAIVIATLRGFRLFPDDPVITTGTCQLKRPILKVDRLGLLIDDDSPAVMPMRDRGLARLAFDS